MYEPIELALKTEDGIADCRLEIREEVNGSPWSAVILLPHLIGGRLQSRVYEHVLMADPQSGKYVFEDAGSIHPAVLSLQELISAAITTQLPHPTPPRF